jgi:pimeloyl-ACP methyl ester carboxylesterase
MRLVLVSGLGRCGNSRTRLRVVSPFADQCSRQRPHATIGRVTGSDTDLLPGITAHTTQTERLRVHWLEAGPPHGVPVILVHGNLSTSRFLEHVPAAAPPRFRFVLPDMRGFGRTEPLPIDATRGLRDWSDDIHALVTALGIEVPVHLLGWSTGGAAISHYALEHGPVASLTYVDPVSPYGFGGVHRDGTLCYPDAAGSGGGLVNKEFIARLRAGDRGADSPFSPRNVMNNSYWAPSHREPPAREDLLVDQMLRTLVGDNGYPGDTTPSNNWPGAAPGTRGILNALSPKYCNWAGIVDLDPKPRILWTHGAADVLVADGSMWEAGTLGAAGHLPGWPGIDVFPPQPMVTQIRDVLGRYAAAGGPVRTETFEGSGHGPMFDSTERWKATFFGFLESVA